MSKNQLCFVAGTDVPIFLANGTPKYSDLNSHSVAIEQYLRALRVANPEDATSVPAASLGVEKANVRVRLSGQASDESQAEKGSPLGGH